MNRETTASNFVEKTPFQKNRIDTPIVKHPVATQGLKRSPAQYHHVNESSQGGNIKPHCKLKINTKLEHCFLIMATLPRIHLTHCN
jgi:hypothetical protein